MAEGRVTVDGVELAYQEAGDGEPIVLLHGNPMSSHLWRKVMPAIADLGRVIAPDLAGMGRSGPAPSYRFVDHRRYLEGFLQAVGAADHVVLVAHDWGGALAFDWAARHPNAVRGLAYCETIVRPRSWTEEPPEGQAFFRSLRSPDGERRVLEDNVFIEEILPLAIPGLEDADLAVYREPYLEPGESRRPMLTWAREIPFDGEPMDVADAVKAYGAWLSGSLVPKLFIAAEPGMVLVGEARAFAESFPNQTLVTVPSGHFVPEDAPEAVVAALRDWLPGLD
jgi:haloalkane dehalogenase